MAHRDTSGSALCRELGIRPVRRTAGRAATGTNGARWEVHERPEAPRPLALPRRLRAPARRAGVFRDTTAVSPGRAERHGRRGRGSPNGARPPDIEALEVLESLQQPGWRPELSRSQQAAPGGRARTAAAPSPACCGAAAWPRTFLQVLVAQGVVPSRSASRLRQGEQGRPLPAGSRHNADRLRPRLETPPGVPGAATSPIWSIPCRTCRSPGWSRGCSPPMGGADRHHDQPRTPDERHQLHEPRARAAESCSASSPGCRPSAHPGHRAPHFLDAPIEVASQAMLPEPQHDPATLPIKVRNLHVTLSIPLDLGRPKFHVRLWHAAVVPTTMPKAGIDKNNQLLRPNRNIRGPIHPHMLAVPQPGVPQATAQLPFQPAVALLHPRHDAATHFASNRIHFP